MAHFYKQTYQLQLKHQYKVIGEHGPDHEKTYTVLLELGDEVYEASSKTIKGAQHLAANQAIEKTKYKKPVARQTRSANQRQRNGKGK